MIIAPSGNLNVLVCHSNVLGIDSQVVWCSHDDELNGSFVSKCLVGPTHYHISMVLVDLSTGTCSATVRVGLVRYHLRIERISLTAAIPLFAIRTLVMTVCPPFFATKSFTLPGAALSTELPPTSCDQSSFPRKKSFLRSRGNYRESEEQALVLQRKPFYVCFSAHERWKGREDKRVSCDCVCSGAEFLYIPPFIRAWGQQVQDVN